MTSAYPNHAIMVLLARDVDALVHGLTDPGGSPALPAAGDANYAYLTADNFTALGQLRCYDLYVTRGLNCYYGLLLKCRKAFGPMAAGDCLVAVRGTMKPIEWLNDALAEIPQYVPGFPGGLGTGFWNLYASMTLADMTGVTVLGRAADAIAAQVTGGGAKAPGKVFVTGHSLGAALATYLAFDLHQRLAPKNIAVAPYYFASPRVGTQDFADYYQVQVPAYDLVNYAGDIVPNVPTNPPFYTLNSGGPLHNVHVIGLGAPAAPPFEVANNHSAVGYARMLDPTNPVAARLPL